MPADGEAGEALAKLRGQRQPADFTGTPLLLKGKIAREPKWGNRAKLVVGWVRDLGPGDDDWRSPWMMNLQLLPSDQAGPIALVAACQAVGAADSALGLNGVQTARQPFKLIEVFYGEQQVGQTFSLAYRYVIGRGRDIRPDEKVIWVIVKTNGQLYGYGTVPDTPNNRKAARLLAERVKVSAPATRPEMKSARVGVPAFLVRLPQEGVYETGDWRYEYRQAGHQRHHGRLTFKDKPIVGAEHYDRVETPWGTLIYLGSDAGFMPIMYQSLTREELARGRNLTPPEGRPIRWATGAATQPVRAVATPARD